jgi:DNA-binding HxlR family transcriptional regulator
MPTSRSYGDACAIARALDVLGERWALLVVRELLLGPQRFSDLRRALPAASSNLLSDRLRELAGRGVIRRRQLPAPAGARVYELTEWGQDLEPVLLALGAWAMPVPLPPGATGAPPAAYRLELDDRVWTARTEAGRLDVRPGEPARPDAALRTDPATLNGLLDGSLELGAAVADGTAVTAGDVAALRRLLQSATQTAAQPAAAPGRAGHARMA